MASSDAGSNPRKRKQPPFKPPRPKMDGSKVSKHTTSTRKSNVGSIFGEFSKRRKSQAKARSKAKAKAAKQRPGVREQEPEDDEDEEEVEEEDADGDAAAKSRSHQADGVDDSADQEEEEEEDRQEEDEDEDEDDADADMMLAEVTHAPPDNETLEPAIPIPLLHRLMHYSFKKPDDTRLSTDARACMGKYIEVFIREGIARCAFEVGEKVHEGGSDSALGRDDGWLEVDDLERVGGQLVLDF